MPFADYKDFADCVAKNQDKNDPEAYCAVIKRQVEGEAYRHPDFDKIYQQFLTHLKDEQEAIDRYATWVQALNLDETKPYGSSMREQFRWVRRHVDFELWKEDRDAKYWSVEAGFPLESMNYNVYSERELLEAARTIEGKTVNVNHKYQLPTVEIVAGQYEDGVVESVLRVPKSLRCPICSKGKTVNDLIESGDIVNVSLEAVCTLVSDDPHKCEGMKFTGLSLLTKDTLPGIPLTRLLPLEAIMVEALQSSTNLKEKKKVTRLKMEVLEENELEKDEHGCIKGKEEWDGEKCVAISAEQITPPLTSEPVEPGVEPDEHGQCPQGMRINALGKCVATEECPEDSHWSDEANGGQGGCVPDTVPKPETPETSVGTSLAPQEDVLTDAPTEQPKPEEQPPLTGTKKIGPMPPSGEPAPQAPASLPSEKPPDTMKPKEPHTCPDGQHHDYDLDQCVPDEPVSERIKRFKAEDKANKLEKNIELLTDTWEKRYGDLDKTNQQLVNDIKHYRREIVDLKTELTKAADKKNEFDMDLRELKVQYATKDNLLKKSNMQIEDLTTTNEELNKKYHATLATNLELSRKLTQAHEDYLAIAAGKERTEEALKRAKIHAKKTIKLKA